MFYILWSMAIVTLIFAVVPFIMTLQFRRYSKKEKTKSVQTVYTPKTTLIVPCKGTDLNFESHILAFLNQDYINYETIFVTATHDDPAYQEIERILKTHHSHTSARLLVAGIEQGRGQKMTNMLKGLHEAAIDTEVYAFMDADIEIYPHLLHNLIQPLQNSDIGATSGIWVFLPLQKTFGSMLKFIWGSGAVLMAADSQNNLAIAAATCIKKDIFERAGISEMLKNTVSDTMAFTHGIRSLGLKIHFVPEAMVISQDESSVSDMISWTNRLATFNRVYNRPFWRKVFFVYALQNFLILAGLTSLIAIALGASSQLLFPTILILSIIAIQILHAFLTFPVIINQLTNYPQAQAIFNQLKFGLCLSAPFVGMISFFNSLHSLRTNIVTWRGVRYRLISNTKTEVLGD